MNLSIRGLVFFSADSQVQHAERCAFACNLPPTLHISVLDDTDKFWMFRVYLLSFTHVQENVNMNV